MDEHEISLADARQLVEEGRDKGVDCPCCGQFAKVYRRKLTRSQIETMIEVWVRQKGYDDWERTEWVYLPEIPQKARDFATTRYFRLTEEDTSRRREDSGRPGYWRVTPEGEEFIRGEIGVAKYALVYDGEVLGYEGETVDIDDVFPDFDLNDLMTNQ